MAKDNKKVELKTVDEESAEESSRFVRLHEDRVEELDDLPVPKIGMESGPTARLDSATRDELKIRSNEPGMDDLIEHEMEPVEDEWETNDPSQKKTPWIWLVAVGVLFSGAIIWSLTQVKDSEKRQDSIKVEAKTVLDKEAEADLEAETMVDSIEAVVRAFHSSKSIDELLKHVRHPERVRPLIEDYYSRHPLRPTVVKSISDFVQMTTESGGDFWLVKTSLESIGHSEVMVENESNEVAKVEWESYVCYQPMDWEKFVNERPGGYSGEFRVMVKPDHFYSHEFADSERFASYMLETKGSDQYLIGYVPRDSQVFKKMEHLFTKFNSSQMPLILKLHVPEDSLSKRGVLIEELVVPRWMYLKSSEADGR